MRRYLLAALAVLACCGSAHAQNYADCSQGQSVVLQPFAKETITVSTTALNLTTSVFQPSSGGSAQMAFLTSETDNLRFWLDGSTPTAALGHLMYATSTSGSSLMICQATISKIRLIRAGAADVAVSITYFRP